MKGKTLDEKKAILAAKQADRLRVQQEIQSLQVKREAYLVEEARKQAGATGITLDDALKQAIRTQATKKGMKFVSPPVALAPLKPEDC
jgi:hypothetical protein